MPGIVSGLYGKLPARGDFVRVGLPRDFTDPWDDWLQLVIAGSQSMMGDDWLPAYLESPVWRFALPPGMCGTRAAFGLMLPSVDKAGRYFPLTFAALSDPGIGAADEAWLDRCEAAGRTALECDTSPEETAGLAGAPDLSETTTLAGATWWSDGGPRIPPRRLTLGSLPSATIYAAMLGAETPVTGEGPWKCKS
jgi:type VI secretion system protein ImpM